MFVERWAIFGICVSLFLMSMFYGASAPIIAPDLINDLILNSQDLVLLGAVFFYSFALIQPVIGISLDRFGARLTMIVLNFIAVAGALIFAHAGGLLGGIVGRSLLGLGMAAKLMGPLTLFTKWFEPKIFASITGLLI
jgi:MFS family permease